MDEDDQASANYSTKHFMPLCLWEGIEETRHGCAVSECSMRLVFKVWIVKASMYNKSMESHHENSTFIETCPVRVLKC